MAAIGEYIFSVSATALLSSVVTSLLKDCFAAKPVKLVCTLVLLLTVIRPIVGLCKLEILDIAIPDFPDGSKWIQDAELASRNAVADIIKRQAETYILDKAAAMGLTITAKIILSSDDPPIPTGVEISGSVSPYLKLRMEEMIQEDLNIAKENQVWTG